MHMSNLRSSLFYYHKTLSLAWNNTSPIVDRSQEFVVSCKINTDDLFTKKEISKFNNHLIITGMISYVR